MPFSSEEIQQAGKSALDHHLKTKPIDQVGVDRPWLKKLMEGRKNFPGAKQYCVEQLRFRYQSNFQWFNGSQVVTYNKRNTIEQAQFPWRGAHDGFSMDEDRLLQNGISIVEGKRKDNSKAERIQLGNLLDEQTEVLRLGFEEKFDQALLLDGTQDADAPTGLDALISLTPATGVVGGIDRSTAGNEWWRNHAATGLTTTTTTGDILTKMEAAWRACIRNGGRPDFIMAGEDFVDGLRDFLLSTYGQLNWQGFAERKMEAGNSDLTFHGVPVIWNPVFQDLDDAYSPATPWEKRCYFINSKHMRLRPIEGQDMVVRKPPRAYDKYEYYWGLTWRGSLTMNRGNAHAALAIS